jgi:hypothetical protein
VNYALPYSIHPQKIRYWRKGTHKPRQQKAADFLKKDAARMEEILGAEEFNKLLSDATTKVPNEVEIAIKARVAAETGLTDKVQDALSPLFKRTVEFQMSIVDLKEQWDELLMAYRESYSGVSQPRSIRRKNR